MAEEVRAEIEGIRVGFTGEGTDIAVTYAHPEDWPRPETKRRINAVRDGAKLALRAVLAKLEDEDARVEWLGFGTNTRVSTDLLLLSKKSGGKAGDK